MVDHKTSFINLNKLVSTPYCVWKSILWVFYNFVPGYLSAWIFIWIRSWKLVALNIFISFPKTVYGQLINLEALCRIQFFFICTSYFVTLVLTAFSNKWFFSSLNLRQKVFLTTLYCTMCTFKMGSKGITLKTPSLLHYQQ